MDSFKRVFEIFDEDGSGKINLDELDKLILALTNKDPTDDEVKQVDPRHTYLSVISAMAKQCNLSINS